MTVDELIVRLTELRDKHPVGSLEVSYQVSTIYLQSPVQKVCIYGTAANPYGLIVLKAYD